MPCVDIIKGNLPADLGNEMIKTYSDTANIWVQLLIHWRNILPPWHVVSPLARNFVCQVSARSDINQAKQKQFNY